MTAPSPRAAPRAAALRGSRSLSQWMLAAAAAVMERMNVVFFFLVREEEEVVAVVVGNPSTETQPLANTRSGHLVLFSSAQLPEVSRSFVPFSQLAD